MSQSEKVKGVVDIVFLLDKSGSMKPCLDALRDNIGVFVNFLANGTANQPSPVKDWRIKVAGYSDVDVDGAAWWTAFPFSRDVPAIQANLGGLVAAGGGDEPESLLDALYQLTAMGSTEKGAEPDPEKWRYRSAAARVVIFFTDATYKPVMSLSEAKGGTLQDLSVQLQAQRVILSGFVPEAPCYDDLSALDKSELEIIGPLATAQASMAEFTKDEKNFRRTLEALAKSVSKSVETVDVL